VVKIAGMSEDECGSCDPEGITPQGNPMASAKRTGRIGIRGETPVCPRGVSRRDEREKFDLAGTLTWTGLEFQGV